MRQAKQHEAEDRRRRELVDARNSADAVIYQVEKALRELGAKIPPGDRSTIERTMDDLKVAKEGTAGQETQVDTHRFHAFGCRSMPHRRLPSRSCRLTVNALESGSTRPTP